MARGSMPWWRNRSGRVTSAAMKGLGLTLAAFGLVALAQAGAAHDLAAAGVGIAALICAATTYRSTAISRFLKIFVSIFSIETVVFGLAVLAPEFGLWPEGLREYQVPVSLPLTVAIFSILVHALAHTRVVRQMTGIADRYFETADRGVAQVWPLPRFSALERQIATAMVVFLVLVNQAQVGILVRLSFFNRDWFNAIQARDAADFWRLLLLVFTPWAFIYVASQVLEFLVQSMLVIRWRRWLTEHFIERWLADHAHYRMSLIANNSDNPDQRIAEDVARFIDGGSTDGYGIYNYTIFLISNLTSLVSFAIVLWVLSGSFTVPGTDIHVPGFLFWVALIYAAAGTFVTHLIGRALVGLYFIRQRVEADFRFALARLREYSEQVALLRGEKTEQTSLLRRFGAVIGNYLALVERRKKLLAFTATYGQLSPIIPYIFAAPFYFAGSIALGVMTQTAGAFARVDAALTFFITYYTSLAGFKSVVDRLTSFDAAIANAGALAAHGPARINDNVGLQPVALENVGIRLPDGRQIVAAENLALTQGESVLLAGPSGSGKSTLFRAISGIWPYGEGRIRIPANARVMVVPQKPYAPIGPLRAALTYPDPPEKFSDQEIRQALVDARLESFAKELDRADIWSQRLSGGEQQRIALARALLVRPDWLFLDESTSAMDEQLEADLYRILATRLPNTTVVSIGHRTTLNAFHGRRIDMTVQEGGHFTPREAAAKAASLA